MEKAEKKTPIKVKETGTVIIQYLDQDNNEIIPSLSQKGSVYRYYHTTPNLITGYVWIGHSDNLEGKYSNPASVVTYYYAKQQATLVGIVLVEYLEQYTNQLLMPSTILTGEVGSPYVVNAPNIDTYSYISNTSNIEGDFTAQPITAQLFYLGINTPQLGKVIVQHREYYTKRLLAHSDILTGPIGDSYLTAPTEITGYRPVESLGITASVFSHQTNTIIYYYIPHFI